MAVSAGFTRSVANVLRAFVLILFWAVIASILADHGLRFFNQLRQSNQTENDNDELAALRRDLMDKPRLESLRPKMPAKTKSQSSSELKFDFPFVSSKQSQDSSDTSPDIAPTHAPSVPQVKPASVESGEDVMTEGVQRLPDCLIIGVRKGGTRALTTFLSLHPNVVTVRQEVEFFNDNNNYEQGIDWYRKQMPISHPTNQILIEKSAEYFHKSYVPERVYKMNKDIQLILVVRDPFVRLVSDYNFIRRYAAMTSSKYPFIELNHTLEELLINKKTGELIYEHTEFGGLHRSQYAKFFKNWLNWFPLEQIHIVNGDRLAMENPSLELRKVESFLGLDHYLTEDKFIFDEKKGFFCTKTNGCLGKEKGHKLPRFDPAFVDKVKRFFRKFNAQFYELSGQKFDWD